MIRNLSSTDPSCPERKESCRSQRTAMRLCLRSRITASNFAPYVVSAIAAGSRKVSDPNKNDQEPILHRSIFSRTQRILPQWTYRHEIAFTVKHDRIKLFVKCCIIYSSRVIEGLRPQQEWSGTYPPQIQPETIIKDFKIWENQRLCQTPEQASSFLSQMSFEVLTNV